MFVELVGVPDADANEALECLCKAKAGPEDASIWSKHPSPFLVTLVEAFTDNGLQVSAAMADELVRWLTGSMHAAKYIGSPAPAPWPWAPQDLAAVHAYLAGKTPAQMTFSDWSMLGDYVVALHAPPSFVQSHASWMAARAGIMGKLEAAKPALALAVIDNALAAAPSVVEQAIAAFSLSPAEAAALQFAEASCGNAIVAVSDNLRARIKRVIVQDMTEPVVPGVPRHSLQTKLTDEFAKFNRDWRRIAVTEAGEAKNQGMVASLPLGARVRRVEHYRGACAFCAKLNGREFTIVAADDPKKDGQKHVWVGKTNVGRSSSPNKIVDGVLVKRTPAELWWPAAGVQHPHCRGMWALVTSPQKTAVDSADWAAWLAAIGAG